MKPFRIGLALALTLSMSACGTLSVFSGNYEETVVRDANNNVVQAAGFFGPKKLKKRQSKEAALGDNAAQAIASVAQADIAKTQLKIEQVKKQAPAMQCMHLTVEQADNLKADAQETYYTGVDRCMERLLFARLLDQQNAIITQLTQGKSDVVQVAETFGRTIVGVSQEGTRKVSAVMNPLSSTLKVGLVTNQAKRASDNQRKVGVAAAENAGDITSTVNVSQDQYASADSNDGGAVGSTTGGEGAPSAVGGAGQGTVSLDSNASSPVLVNVGRDNNASFATDQARTFNETRGTQQLDSSATGGVNDDSNVDFQPIVDDLDNNEGVLDNQPNNNPDFL